MINPAEYAHKHGKEMQIISEIEGVYTMSEYVNNLMRDLIKDSSISDIELISILRTWVHPKGFGLRIIPSEIKEFDNFHRRCGYLINGPKKKASQEEKDDYEDSVNSYFYPMENT
jgi:hypothetical protein